MHVRLLEQLHTQQSEKTYTKHYSFCPACNTTDALIENPWHFVGCTELKRSFKSRHDQMVGVLRAHLDRLHTDVQTEPAKVYDTHLHNPNEKGLRHDIKVTMDNKVTLLDISITHPLAKSYLLQAKH